MVVVPGYRLGEPLGVGGTATVYRAVAVDGRAAAVKLARAAPGARARLEREAAALAAIGPRHAPAVYGVGLASTGPFLAMELITDPSLACVIAERGRPPIADGLALFARIVGAVAAAHAAGVIHRDLSPANVLCGAARVRLIDLGLAGAIGGSAGQTHVGDVVGTAAYMAPEQWRPGAVHDERTDVYALGCLLVLVTTGAPPFTGDRGTLQAAHLGQRPELPSRRVADAAVIDELATRCLAKAPGDRVPSVAALREALAGLTRAGRASVAPPVAPTLPASTARLFATFTSAAEPSAIDERLRLRGARMVHGDGDRCAAVIEGPDVDEAIALARALAQELIAEQLATAVVLELHDAVLRPRRPGPPRIVAPALTTAAAYPRADDPPGILVGARVAARLGGVTRPLPARTDRWIVDEAAPAPAPDIDVLYGRDAELAEVLASAHDALGGGGPVIATVLAGPGHGASAFARELVGRLRARRDATTISLAAAGPKGSDHDALFRTLVAAALELEPALEPTAGLELLRGRLDPVAFAAVAVVLGWRRPEDDDVLAAAVAPGAMRTVAARAVALALRARAGRAPLAIVLDDADRADVASLDALELAALAEAGAPLWICALGRPELSTSRPGWGHRARARPTWQLGPLAAEAADQLLRAALAPVTDVPAKALAHLRARAGGVPLLLLELVASLRRAGALRRHDKGSAGYLATDELDRLPATPTVSDLAARALAALSPGLVAHAELTAVVGEVVDVAELRAVIARLELARQGEEVPLDARVGLERLVAAGFLHARGDRFAFRHALVRDAILRIMPADRRARWHAAAAAHLATAVGLEARTRLAAHLAGAGRHAEAAAVFAELAEFAHARHAYVDAERWYSAALRHDQDAGVARAGWLRRRGVVRTRLGRYEDARADLDAALASAPAEAAVEIWLDLATTLDWCDEWPASAEAGERAAALAGPEPPRAIAAQLALARGRSRHRFSRDDEAVPLLTEAVALADPSTPAGRETVVIGLVLLGYILPGQGRLADAAAVLARVIAMCERTGDRWHLAAAHNNRVMLWTALGERDRLIADLEQVRTIGRELGYDRMEWFALVNLAEALFWLGEHDRALVPAEAAIALDDRSLGERARPRSRLLRARILAWRADPRSRAAVDDLDQHQASARRDGRTESLLVPTEQLLLAAVRLQVEGAGRAAWAELLTRARRELGGQELVEVFEAAARAARRAGELDDERAAIVEALSAASGVHGLGRRRLRARLEQLNDGPGPPG